MEYVLFLGFNKIGIFPNEDSAMKAIDAKGIYNVCGFVAIDGKLKIVSRKSVVKM